MNRRAFCRALPLFGLLIVLLGCGGDTTQRYVPAAASARSGLETALSTWKSGAAHGTITTSTPAIDVFDARWQSGKKLESYEILEEITGQEHPQFKVRLKLADAPEETTTYRVVGIDPLLVFRDADYQKTTGM